MTRPLHLYIHIPFCQQRCAYCSFPRVVGHCKWHEPYVRAVVEELEQTVPLLPTDTFSTLYIGGGTPSFLPTHLLATLLRAVRARVAFTSDAEVTVECNPHPVTQEWVETMLAAGVNRFSLGVQSLNDHELEVLGRVHNAETARRAVAVLRGAGVKNLSIDLIYGVPDQTMQAWQATVRGVLTELVPEHVSMYALDLSEHCHLKAVRQHQPWLYAWADDDLVMDMYWYAVDVLRAAGFEHYEISNLARPGCICRHNWAYWDVCEQYLGLGAAAHSFCALAPEEAPRRFHNLHNVRSYCGRVASGASWRISHRPYTRREFVGEEVYLGLRRIQGVQLREEHYLYFADTIEEHIDAGFLERRPGGFIALTRRGIEISNLVMAGYV